MKIIICVLALILAVNGSPVSRDLGLAVKNFYYKVRDQMPCGIQGSKPLAPFEISQEIGEDPLEYNIEDWKLKFGFTKVKIDGLNTFNILESKYNVDTKQFNIKFVMPKMSIFAKYYLQNKFDNEFLTAKFNNNGTLKWDLSNDAEYEISFYFNNDKTSGDLIVEKVKFVHPDSDKDILEDLDDINEVLKEFLKGIEKKYDDVYQDQLTLKFNKVLKGRKTVEDLADYLNKVAGDSEHGPFNEPLCNHV